MASTSIASPSQSLTNLSPALTRLAILLALSIFINYIDRGNLAIAAPLIQTDLGLSPYQLGILFSSFFWSYAIFQIVSGWLVDRFPVNSVLAFGFFLWSAATFGTGLVHGFALLLAMRLILGIGESVAYPSYSKIISAHFSEFQRGRANSIICAGQASGPGVGTFFGGILLAHTSWRVFFIALGIASSLWLLPWLNYVRKTRLSPSIGTHAAPPADESLILADSHSRTESNPPLSAGVFDILCRRSAWGTFAGLFAYNYVWYFFITWLPLYLVRERHFSIQGMSIASGLAFIVLALTALVSGWVSDHWIAVGGTPTCVRKTFTGVGPLIAASLFFVGIVANHALAIALLFLACIGLGMCTSNLWAVTQTLAGPATSGKWTGLQNFMGNLAGWIAPTAIGLIVQDTGNFFWVFVMTSGVSVLGALSWVFVVGPIREVRWRHTSV
jgi:MFS transporter, ACS family, D-galactonate transporter